MDKKLKIIGKCPVCGTGQVIEYPKRYACDNAVGKTKCPFFMHKEIKKTVITPEIAESVIRDGRTEQLTFTNAEGMPFKARLVVDGTGVKLTFDNEFINGKCPICGGRVQVTKNGYNCENRMTKTQCPFHINKKLGNRDITKEEVEKFLNGEVTILDHFMSNMGVEYSAYLETTSTGYVRTNSYVSKCPECGGDILVGPKFFNCSNYKTEGCQFRIPRKVFGHDITIKEAKSLCEEGMTEEVEIPLKNGTTVNKRLTFDSRGRLMTI